jgi:hypothetical protein
VQGLVALLKAYNGAMRSGDEKTRFAMAGAIFQGISPDPELFLNRVDLLSAYSMIEHVFIFMDADGHAAYSLTGQRHVRSLEEYCSLIGRLKEPLRDDLPSFRPVNGGYSPYGVLFGLPSTLIEHMGLKATDRDAEARFSLEDAFDDDPSTAKLTWVNGWRELPHVPREVQRTFDFPQQFAEEIYARISTELGRTQGSRTGCLYIGPSDAPELATRYLVSSDRQLVAGNKAEPIDRAQLLASRQEGHYLVSHETPGGWVALKKELLTEVLGAGLDARIETLPPGVIEVLRLMLRI